MDDHIEKLQQRGLVSNGATQRVMSRRGDSIITGSPPAPIESAATSFFKRRPNESYDDWDARTDPVAKASLPLVRAYEAKIGRPTEQWSVGDVFGFQNSPEMKALIKQFSTPQAQ